jgi:hypothetical protein
MSGFNAEFIGRTTTTTQAYTFSVTSTPTNVRRPTTKQEWTDVNVEQITIFSLSEKMLYWSMHEH